MPQHITLSELQSLIKRGIDDAHPLPYWVTAEISELKVNYSGYCYLELVEKGGANHVPKAKISAVIWRSTYGMIASYFGAATGGQTLCAGLKVLVKALVSYHELYGLSLQITDIDPSYTLGDMERQRRQTIEQLQRDGVFDMNRELPMPAVVQRLAVVSSRNAAGYQDFMKELSSGPYRFEVTLFDAFMQGAESEESIVRALETVADALDDFDAVVLIRGGGSQSDLGSFDSYRLCCHLAQFPLPVIAGIGHDKDRSVADLVAAVSLKTPTAVAVYLKNKMAEFEALLDSLRGRLAEWAEEMLGGCTTFLRERAMRLEQQTMRLVHECSLGLQRTGAELGHRATEAVRRSGDRLGMLRSGVAQAARFALANHGLRADNLASMLRHRSFDFLSVRRRELALTGDLVASRDPRRILEMGFSVVRQKGGALADPLALHPGDRVEIETHSRTFEAQIDKIKPI